MQLRKSNKFISRLAPSPSSKIHLGNALSFLLTWGFARKYGGTLRLRLDDLDERCKNSLLKKQVIDDLRWLEIDWDGPVHHQCERDNIYEDYYRELVRANNTYPCFCSRADLNAASAPHRSDTISIYSGKCKSLSQEEISSLSAKRAYATRLRILPDTKIDFTDLICGKFEQDLNLECGDFIIRRSDGVFAYHLTSVVDDIEMGITHVIRGNDLLSTTPKHIYLNKLLYNVDNSIHYAHHPLLVDRCGRRLAKRDNDKTIEEMAQCGATPASIRGQVASLLSLIDYPFELKVDEFIDLLDFGALGKCDREIVVTCDSN